MTFGFLETRITFFLLPSAMGTYVAGYRTAALVLFLLAQNAPSSANAQGMLLIYFHFLIQHKVVVLFILFNKSSINSFLHFFKPFLGILVCLYVCPNDCGDTVKPRTLKFCFIICQFS